MCLKFWSFVHHIYPGQTLIPIQYAVQPWSGSYIVYLYKHMHTHRKKIVLNLMTFRGALIGKNYGIWGQVSVSCGFFAYLQGYDFVDRCISFSRKINCFIISFCQGCKFMSEGYLWIPRKTNSNDSTVCMANYKILPVTVKK